MSGKGAEDRLGWVEGNRMGSMAHLTPILHDDGLTRNLGDEEARVLIEWLIEWAEQIALEDPTNSSLRIQQLWRRGRAMSRFVSLWQLDQYGPALQLAASERFDGPLPNGPVDPCLLMLRLLQAESRCMREAEIQSNCG